MKRAMAFGYGLISYATFFASAVCLILFTAGVGLPKTVDAGAGPLGPTLAIDLLLVAVFGIQHSVMARAGFKRWWTRIVPEPIERSTYVLVSGVLLLLLVGLWRPIPAQVWSIEHPVGAGLARTLFWAAWALAVGSTFVFSHTELFGLKQVHAYLRGRSAQEPSLRMPLLYRVVRHPMHAGMFLGFWATPRMTVGHLILALGMSAYILIGIHFEERGLVRRFGDAYADYRRRVPKLLPWPRPRSVRRRRRVAVAALVVLATVGAATAAGRGTDGDGRRGDRSEPARLGTGTIRVDGLDRTFSYHVPSSAKSRPAVILAFHGSNGSGARLRHFTGGELERLADRHGFIAVYPEGIEGNWNGCRAKSPSSANRRGIDDVGFVRELIAWFVREHGADPAAAYALGFSGGGHMVYRLALEAPRAVRGAAVFAANLPAPDELDCRPSGHPASIMIVNGTADLVNPYGGGDVIAPLGTPLGRARSARESVEYFVRLAGYAGASADDPVLAPARPGGTGVERSGWRRPGADEVVLYTIRGGGHAIPGPRSRLPSLVGATERRFNGIREAIRFFRP